MVIKNCYCEAIYSARDNKKSPLLFSEIKDSCFNDCRISWHGFGVKHILNFYFCPWCGKEFSDTFRLELSDLLDRKYDIGVFLNDLKIPDDIPNHLKHLLSRDWFEQRIQNDRHSHQVKGNCDALEYQVEESYPIVYVPNIRAYGIRHKKKYKGYSTINFCPFCGEKLQDRLDEKLTEILREEYGLESWEDYKKAPPEFHTDEWWKKRGL